jgi:ferritin-like metal-binding protein YciE
LEETKGHVAKVERVFQCFDEEAKGKTCEATVGLLKEGDEIAADFKGSPAINAALISAGQKVEHYETASYGCLHAWAGVLGNEEAAAILEEILEEEKAANETLTKLARSSCNDEALGESDDKAPDDVAQKRGETARGGIRPGNPRRSRPETVSR